VKRTLIDWKKDLCFEVSKYLSNLEQSILKSSTIIVQGKLQQERIGVLIAELGLRVLTVAEFTDKINAEKNTETKETIDRIILVGLCDLPKEFFAEISCEVETIIFAPEEYSNAFDEWGIPKYHYWNKKRVDLSDRIIITDNFRNLAESIKDEYSRISKEHQINFTFLDKELIPYVRSIFVTEGFSAQAKEINFNYSLYDLPFLQAADKTSYNFIVGCHLLPTDYLSKNSHYKFHLLLNSNPNLVCFAARENMKGEQLRLLPMFLPGETSKLLNMLERFYSATGESNADHANSNSQDSAFKGTVFNEIPPPNLEKLPINSFGVTALREYVRCPYRFYLKYILKLENIETNPRELDARRYGTLVHEILKECDVELCHAGQAEKLLLHHAELVFKKLHADRSSPEIEIQFHLLKQRLRYLAAWQESWTRAGWEIIKIEVEMPEYLIVCPSGRLRIRGRIDRIDRNKRSGEIIVFDYKTSEQQKSPKSAHLKNNEWIDFQLPIYAISSMPLLGLTKPPKCGYIALSSFGSEIKEYEIEWSEAQLESAKQRLIEIGESIIQCKFWPPTDEIVEYTFEDEYSLLFPGVSHQ
jgi:RecB family exonuclease